MSDLGLTGPPPPEPVKVVRADALARADAAWNARVAGHTWAEVATIAGYGSDTAAIDGVKDVLGTLPRLQRSELRDLWRARLETAWQQVTLDMHARVPGATTAAVRIVQAAAALDGLNEAAKVDLRVDSFLDAFGTELRHAGF